MKAVDRLPPEAVRPGTGHLVIEMRPGQQLLVNGAVLLFRGRCSLVLCNRVRFLFGRQILDPAEATSPARRLYLALQVAYAGQEEEREASIVRARRLAAEQMPLRSPEGRAILRQALQELAFDRYRAALLLVRRLFDEDDATGQGAGAAGVAAEDPQAA